MFLASQNKWAYLLVFFLGSVLTILLQKHLLLILKKLSSKSKVIRRYWLFVVIFSILLSLGYFLIFHYAPSNRFSDYISIIGQVAALVFAIFVGYFAFLQLVESRITSLKQEGFIYYKQKAYARATNVYELIHSTNSKDFGNLAELLELYLVQKDFQHFDEKAPLLEKTKMDKRDDLLILYLTIAADLLREHLGDARKKIARLIIFKKESAGIPISWDFKDMLNSPAYQNLEAGDSKKVFDALIGYLSDTMPEEERQKFENSKLT